MFPGNICRLHAKSLHTTTFMHILHVISLVNKSFALKPIEASFDEKLHQWFSTMEELLRSENFMILGQEFLRLILLCSIKQIQFNLFSEANF